MKKSLTRSNASAAVVAVLAPGDVVDIDCTDLIARTGQAVGRADGMVVYVLGPVPGERARVRIESVKAKYAVAELVELLLRSPDRAEPFCPVFGTCGGCQVQHVAYPAQLRWKRSIVENALRRLGGIADARVGLPIGMDDPRAYRNKMALVVTRTPGDSPDVPQTTFGFYAARSHDVVPIEGCPIVMPQLDRAIAGLWDAAADRATASAFNGARHAIARVGKSSGEAVLSITTERASPSLAAGAAALAAKLPGTIGISNSFEPPSENAVMGRRNVSVYGSPEMHEEIDGVRFRVSPASFFQVNSEIVGKIFGYLSTQLGRAGRIIDLYCGAGTFAIYFAKHGARVVGIEENPSAVREAKANAALNEVSESTIFINGRVDGTLRSKIGAEALAAADVVFLDPPRKGSDEATLDALIAARVPHVWYLSCNPATLARDLAQLVAGGYRLGAVQPFDMFPQTGHIEALASLHRADVAPLPFPVAGESQ
jgi:23S rRNA (uracil1939-C5)-methyltransferase